MKRLLGLGLWIATLVLLSFLIVEAVGVPLLTEPQTWMERGRIWAAGMGAGLLVLDVLLPIPSSVIMIAHGAILGMVPGFLVSLVASTTGAMLGWWIGRQGSDRLAARMTQMERDRAASWLDRHGLWAVVLSRMLPILSETVAVLSGVSGMRWQAVLVASVLGSIPPSLVYAVAGAVSTDFSTGAFVALGVFVLAGLCWWWGQRYAVKAGSLSGCK